MAYHAITCVVCHQVFRPSSSASRYCGETCPRKVLREGAGQRRATGKAAKRDRIEDPAAIERKLAAWEAYRKRHPLALDPWQTRANTLYNPYFDTRGV